ncbi:MAG: ketol-acid reductoisomerase [Candidatus Marinimicrobia bacterium]|nr:ketol-acid reductoisomerase [Candidatus Neomarinimicrobiota bacterium]MBL7023220.1 ketol-acid reductoisomerase [Candidatus Neomarinimicrobiota bacterium]
MPKLYFDNDANLDLIQSTKVAIIGYGNQGRAQALNLTNSGVDVVVGLRENSSSSAKALNDGLVVKSISDATQWADVISLLIPDQVMADAFNSEIKESLKINQTILVSHGYNVHYKQIQPPDFIDVIMVAPSGPGKQVREEYVNGRGIPNLIAVHQDYTGNAKDIALSYSKAIGGTRAGAFFSTFKEEVETDLFGEQVVLTGGIPKLIQSAFKVLVEAGYQPITAWFVCYYELKTIVDSFHQKGFAFMNKAISDTAEYGGKTRGARLINDSVENEMRTILKEIQTGKFFDEWSKESEKGLPNLQKMRENDRKTLIEEIGQFVMNQIANKTIIKK